MAAEYSKLAAVAAEKEDNSTTAISHLQQRKDELEAIVSMQREQISTLVASTAAAGSIDRIFTLNELGLFTFNYFIMRLFS